MLNWKQRKGGSLVPPPRAAVGRPRVPMAGLRWVGSDFRRRGRFLAVAAGGAGCAQPGVQRTRLRRGATSAVLGEGAPPTVVKDGTAVPLTPSLGRGRGGSALKAKRRSRSGEDK